MEPVFCSQALLAETLVHLQAAGRRGTECVVLWLARPASNLVRVERIHRPEQFARADVFRIPPASMRRLMEVLARDELMIAAQVHSHPREAFHSVADDTWAVVRHENALSLVVPDFALHTGPDCFDADAKVFRLTPGNSWLEVSRTEVPQWLVLD